MIARWREGLKQALSSGVFFFQAEDGIRDRLVTGVQTCALPISSELIARITEPDEEERMPPKSKGPRLSPTEIDLLKRWVAQGGNYARHWSYEIPTRPALQIGRASCRERV